MSDRLKIGVVGAGWPSWQHLEGYRKVPQVEVTSLCDLDEERLQRIGDEYDIRSRYRSFDEMLVRERLDAVSVCTPNHLHSGMTVKALERGIHVLCEKPMATTSRLAREMAEAGRKSGRVLMIAHMLRFHENTRLLKEWIGQGKLGSLYFARAWWVRRNGIPGMGGWFTQKSKSGGGVLIDLGVHLLDLVLWLLDFPAPVRVSASLGNRFAYRGKGSMDYGMVDEEAIQRCDVEDYAVAHVTFHGGASLFLQLSWASPIKGHSDGLEVWGEEGGVRLGLDGRTLERYSDEDGVPVDVQPSFPESNPFDREIDHFIGCIRRGTPPLCLPDEGVKTMELIERIYDAQE